MVTRLVNDRAELVSRGHRRGLPIERLPFAFIEYDQGVRVLEWNPAAEKIFGFTKTEALGKNALDLILPSTPIAHIQRILDRIWAGDLEAHSVNQNVTKDGRVIECDWFNTPIVETNGKVTTAISLVRNITTRTGSVVSASNLDRVSDQDLWLLSRLRPRQREVLGLVAEGYRTKEIADKLELSVKTIEMHRANIMDALEIRSIAGLVRYAIRVGLTSAQI
jgi:PAS domain S-box-containing protein